MKPVGVFAFCPGCIQKILGRDAAWPGAIVIKRDQEQDPNMDNSRVIVPMSVGAEGSFGHFRSLEICSIILTMAVFDCQCMTAKAVFCIDLRWIHCRV